MLTQDFKSGIDDLQDIFDSFNHATSTKTQTLGSPLLNLLAYRVAQAIGEGMLILESECHRRRLTMPAQGNQWTDASIVRALELDLNREENAVLRWLLISYWVALCNFDAIGSNVEALATSNVDDVVWLVAGALWVQWASGQPTTHQLRGALTRVRARHIGLDAQLAAVLAGSPNAARDAALIAERLLADPTATLPTVSTPSG